MREAIELAEALRTDLAAMYGTRGAQALAWGVQALLLSSGFNSAAVLDELRGRFDDRLEGRRVDSEVTYA
jgi:hypothetical protein